MQDEKEKLAELCHDQWSGWMKYLFSKCVTKVGVPGAFMPDEFYNRWQKQMNTAYENLSEKEKDSDRKEADKFLKLLVDM